MYIEMILYKDKIFLFGRWSKSFNLCIISIYHRLLHDYSKDLFSVFSL